MKLERRNQINKKPQFKIISPGKQMPVGFNLFVLLNNLNNNIKIIIINLAAVVVEEGVEDTEVVMEVAKEAAKEAVKEEKVKSNINKVKEDVVKVVVVVVADFVVVEEVADLVIEIFLRLNKKLLLNGLLLPLLNQEMLLLKDGETMPLPPMLVLLLLIRMLNGMLLIKRQARLLQLKHKEKNQQLSLIRNL